tara:strand:+ start:7472 stop:8251 length:780 start_codon:yes stop_codon:yes gene_type:complete
MSILKHRYITNFNHYFLKLLFSFPGMVAVISIIRFIYLVYIKRNHKTLYPIDSKPDEMGYSSKSKTTSLQKNTKYLNNHFKDLKGRIREFNATRSLVPLWPLMSLDFIKPINMKVLSIGPRMESELFKLVSMGFQLKNIKSIDIQSYSDLIELGDIIKMPYEDNSFDLVIIGWVLVYTNEPKKAIEEVVRVLKDKGVVSMCHSHSPQFQEHSNIHINTSKTMLDFFGNNLGYVYFKYHPFDENEELEKGRSNFILSIKK